MSIFKHIAESYTMIIIQNEAFFMDNYFYTLINNLNYNEFFMFHNEYSFIIFKLYYITFFRILYKVYVCDYLCYNTFNLN